jgi:flagellar hook-associated protein 3 FlgL
MTFVSTFGASTDQTTRLLTMQSRLEDLQRQLTTGQKADLYKGLDTDVLLDKRTRTQLTELTAYTDNIMRGKVLIQQKENALAGIKTQARNVWNSLMGQIQKGEIDETSVRQIANGAYEFITNLLNTSDGDSYLFAGSDTDTAPLRDTGSMDVYYSALNPLWTSGTLTINPPATTITEEYIQQIDNLPDTTAGFSGSLTNAKKNLVRIDTGVEIDHTVLANEKPLRDILVSIGTLRNLPDEANAPGATTAEKRDNYFQIFNHLAATIVKAIDGLEDIENRLGSVQATMAQMLDDHTVEKKVKMDVIGEIEHADTTEIATQLNFMQVQLEASYRVTASVRDLSLVYYL